ncbi:hypothetical protein AYJ57_20960 (plasmid) [Salipiger sp. CCB-MM3]|uniref:porin n=1 Tax=Salipiger sp. CCB-MM3 TaxID=1792508 RepID=UPI00080ABB3E|nr:porin [Salipiger sp. CCB-MM3]ANT62950.1 hypothetical protein AYJ57_20960 [Salipiger sp. CCB-MM3]
MNNRFVSALALTAALLPVGAASAAEYSAAATLGYAHSDLEGLELDTTSLDLSLDAQATEALSFGIDVALSKSKPEDGEDFNLPSFMADMEYRFGNGFSAGIYAERFTLDTDLLLGTDIDFDSYGVTAGYARANYKVEAFYGETVTDPELDDVTIQDFGILAAMAPNSQSSIAARYVRSNAETDGTNEDWEAIELAGTYQINDPWAVFAGASFGQIDSLSLDVDTYGFGVSYNLDAVSEIPATLSLELARTTLDVDGYGGDADTVRVGVTFPLGAGGAKLPLNSVAGAVQNGRHSALSSAALAAF